MKLFQGFLLACSMLMFMACSSDDAPEPDPAHVLDDVFYEG